MPDDCLAFLNENICSKRVLKKWGTWEEPSPAQPTLPCICAWACGPGTATRPQAYEAVLKFGK